MMRKACVRAAQFFLFFFFFFPLSPPPPPSLSNQVLRISEAGTLECSDGYFRLCEEDESLWYFVSERYGGGIKLAGYADADFASKAANRRSVSGGIVTCGGGSVSWFSRTQKCVTLSTTEAEYVALGDVVKEIIFLRQIWRFMLPQVGMPCIPIFEDNQGAIQLAQNPISNSNSKHIDVRHHFLRELVERKEISVIHVPSPYQRADFLTKSLSKDSFESHREFVMNLA
ncbi:unnamed protein product [Ectocarpus sp. CCAP 1310/34]|nr:unnamed protein product [Ectocarpus sp. CCAP 1310/34]